MSKVAFVFGGSRGIGAATVERLAADGYAVAFTYVSREDKARALADAIGEKGGKAFPIQADSADPIAIKAAVATAFERYGQFDVVVVNAGVIRLNLVADVPLADLDAMLNINVRGAFLSVQATVPHVKDGGRIITIGSNTAIRTGHAGSSVYQMTKGAIAALVKGLALDLAPRRITVNNVQPGPTATDILGEHTDMVAGMTALKRVGQPEEIAGLVAYIARDESAYMTGASLTIDGGYTL